MLFSASEFRDLVSGRRRGATAALERFALRLAAVPYRWAVVRRNRRYDRGAAKIHRLGVPVVSVGNLTLGGTGKTPMVEWLARWLRDRQVRVAIVSRGYGAAARAENDEALELRQKLPDVPHVQNPDRVAAARQAIGQFQCQVILLDDAFQHRRIGRDLDIVMLDATEPFGFGRVFPAGLLREPVEGLQRADVVALARADMLTADEREALRHRVRPYSPQAAWVEAAHAPRALISADGREESLEAIRNQPVAAFCGIGNPAAFLHTLQTCGYRVADFREFPDHRRYGPADLDALANWADRLEVAAVLCTHKDLVKIPCPRLGRRPLWAVRVGLEFLAGQQALENRLLALLSS